MLQWPHSRACLAAFIGSGDVRRHEPVGEDFVTRFEIRIFQITPETEPGGGQELCSRLARLEGLLWRRVPAEARGG